MPNRIYRKTGTVGNESNIFNKRNNLQFTSISIELKQQWKT